MRPISALIAHLPLGSRPSAPPDPPLVDDDTFHAWLHEVSDRHDGIGWRVAGGIPRALATRLGSGEHRFADSPRDEVRAVSEGDRIDAFSGRVAGPPGGTPSERMLQVAAWARSASEVLQARAREGHPLASYQRVDGRWTAVPLPTGEGAPHVGILDGDRLWVLESPAGRPLTDIGMDIGWALSTRQFEELGPEGIGRAELAAVVALDRRSIRDARHCHRSGGLEGPWLGVAIGNRTHQAPPLELVAASRLEVEVGDLAGLMRRLHVSADTLLANLDEDAPRAIARDLTRRYGDLWRPRRSWRKPPRTEGREEYVARKVDGAAHPGDLDAFAYALGVALHRFAARRGEAGPLAPSVRVPAGDREVLTAVQVADGGTPEAFEAYTRRVHQQRMREHSGHGLLSEWQRRLARLPIAPAAHERLLAAIEGTSRLDGPVAALNGVGEVSYSELTPRRDAPFEVFSGTTPPGGPHDSAAALHAHRVGDDLYVVLTARGDYAERSAAAELLDLALEALPR